MTERPATPLEREVAVTAKWLAEIAGKPEMEKLGAMETLVVFAREIHGLIAERERAAFVRGYEAGRDAAAAKCEEYANELTRAGEWRDLFVAQCAEKIQSLAAPEAEA